MKTRFSKQALADTLWAKHREIQDKHHFDPLNGTAQLRESDMLRAVDYGTLREIERIVEEFDLPGHSDGYMQVIK